MKPFQYIIIALFIFVVVLWGVLLCGCNSPDGSLYQKIHSEDSVKKVQRLIDTVYIHDTIYKAGRDINIKDNNGDMIINNK